MSAIQNIFRRISSALAKRQLVGRDVAGNCYYKKIESDFSGGSFERRMMVPGDKCVLLKVACKSVSCTVDRACNRLAD